MSIVEDIWGGWSGGKGSGGRVDRGYSHPTAEYLASLTLLSPNLLVESCFH